MESAMTEKESIQLIKEMMQKSKTNLKGDASIYLLWGWLVFIASIAHYVLMTQTDFAAPYLVWPVLMSLGSLVYFYIIYKQNKNKKVSTYVDTFMAYFWSGWVVSFLLVLGFVGSQIGFEIAYPILIVLLGLGAFVSGGALGFNPLIIGGAICWFIGAAAFQVGFEYQLLLMALAVFLTNIVPGYLLKNSEG